MQGISQSLAGRAAVLSLPPFTYSEKIGNADNTRPVEKISPAIQQRKVFKPGADVRSVILRGFFPEIASNPKVDRRLWCGSYISTYLERDVRNILNIGDLNQFERFLKICATRTGQILNISDIAKDIGVSTPTAKRWLSILEAGYQVYLLYPYYRNIGKRLVKSPKLYFCDTALATYLLGIHDKRALINSPNFGALFETMVINDFLKRYYAFGNMPSMYYLRTRDGLEIDLLIETGQKIHMFEIKSSSTIMPAHASSLLKAKKVFGKTAGISAVISQSGNNIPLRGNIFNIRWDSLLSE
jgi:predicted AAA+ superfamily ATPase